MWECEQQAQAMETTVNALQNVTRTIWMCFCDVKISKAKHAGSAST